MSLIKLSLGVASLAVVAIACGAPEPSSSFGNPKPGSDPSNGNGVLGSAADNNGTANKSGGSSTPEEFTECATKTAIADQKPVYLVFMFDKSESMVAHSSPKWSAAKAASKAFFEASDAKNVHASLTFFPDQADYSCSSNDYSSPAVPMTTLPNTTLGEAMDHQTPDGGTPTYVALQGAIAYAKNVAANEGKDGNVAIVLVTDGIPDSVCSGNSIAAVKTLAAGVASELRTYVIGVGNQLTSLKDIAIGGGTNNAFIVSTTDPTKIQADFLGAVNSIKAAAVSCDYDIPAPPAGEQLDRSKVNVIYKSGGTNDTISYNQTCSAGTGWHYDDANDPKRILLCEGSCAGVKAKPGGEMQVLFGCATKGGGVK